MDSEFRYLKCLGSLVGVTRMSRFRNEEVRISDRNKNELESRVYQRVLR